MQTQQIIALARKHSIIRAADLENAGIARTMLPYLVGKGVLRRVSRGAYGLASYVPEHESFLQVAISVPHGVICLLSALQFHEITTQMPAQTWVAIERGRRRPTGRALRLRVVQLSSPVFSQGIETHDADGVPIRIYSPARTIVDCFKFRNRIGLDLALEALQDALEQKKATRDEIWLIATKCRMSRVMRPYLEML